MNIIYKLSLTLISNQCKTFKCIKTMGISYLSLVSD